MADFVMPSLGADMDSGTIVEWRVAPGDTVHRGDIVAVVDTEKSDIEVEVFADGVVEELLVEPGREVDVGTPLARVRPLDAAATESAAEPVTVPPPELVAPAAITVPVAPIAPRSSPLARRRAAEAGIDLATLVGSGPGGAVVAADLNREAPPPSAAPEPVAPRSATERHQNMRHAIGELMARSAREIPHYHLASTVDLSAALTWLAAENERRAVAERILPAALLLKASARAAAMVPGFNGTWHDGFHPADHVHLGVAIALRGGGLMAPAIHDADLMPLDDLMVALRDLVERARGGRLRGSEMSDPTLTVTNLGDQGADEVHGVIYPPQVALVGFGRIIERPWAAGGMVGARPTVRLSLAADHRVSEGHEGSRLLTTIDRLLQAPETL